MKNFTKIMLIVLIAATAVFMTGCTEDEIAVLNLINESQSLTQYRIDGVYGVNSSDVTKFRNDDIQYTYEVNVSNGGYMHLKINGTLNNFVLKEPLEFYSYDNKLYISKNLLRYLNNAKQLDNENDLTYLLDELDATVLKDTDFLVCEGNEDPLSFVFALISKFDKTLDFMSLNMGAAKNLSQDLIDKVDYNKSAIRFLTDAYEGFESETVSKIDGGYQITFGMSRLFDTLTNFAEYTYSHRDEIYEKNVYYTNLFYDSLPCPDYETLEKIEKLRAADLPDEQKFIKDTDELYNLFHYGSQFFNSKEYVMDYIGGNYFSYSITKNGGSYEKIERGLITFTDPNDENHSENTQLYHEQTKTPTNVNVNLPQHAINYSDYSIESEAAKNRINPCVGLEIETEVILDNSRTHNVFVNDSFGNIIYTCRYPKYKLILKNGNIEYMDMTKTDDNIYTTDRYTEYGYSIFSDDSGSLYLPLRNYAKALGEEVVWDENTETASIRRGNELITIDGFLLRPGYADNDLYFCRIREFEKLGYTIQYIEDDRESEYPNIWKNVIIRIMK